MTCGYTLDKYKLSRVVREYEKQKHYLVIIGIDIDGH